MSFDELRGGISRRSNWLTENSSRFSSRLEVDFYTGQVGFGSLISGLHFVARWSEETWHAVNMIENRSETAKTGMIKISPRFSF